MNILKHLILSLLLLILIGCQTAVKEPEVAMAPPPEVAAPPIPGLAPGGKCALKNELLALNSRALQTELTLAALSCGERKRYTEFVKSYRPQLIVQAKVLRKYFVRNYQREANFRLDQFVTRLANAYGNRIRARESNLFCKEARQHFIETLVKPTPKLVELSNREQFTTMHGIRQCE